MPSKLTVSFALICGLGVMLMGTNAKAQTASDLQNSSSQGAITTFEREDDPNNLNNVFSPDRASGTSLLNLLNRIQQVNGRSSQEFANDQNENFNDAVEEFRKKQQESEATSSPQPSTAPVQ
ncbi:MAG: hypothetical protein ACFCU8_16605 [Thermosynechococcaceae cyanobacterium]